MNLFDYSCPDTMTTILFIVQILLPRAFLEIPFLSYLDSKFEVEAMPKAMGRL